MTTLVKLCQDCANPTGSTHGGRKFCDLCKADRAATIKARWVDEQDPLPTARNRTMPPELRTEHARLSEIDRQVRDLTGSSDCYFCKALPVCRANVKHAGFKLPCFEER